MILVEMGSHGDTGGSSGVGAPSSILIEESGGGGGGGSRWPRQQTLALLKIRSDMDPAFRDASLKAPLWEEVSRKMAELGFQRSAKKCREKFENVYKYHKRTKDGRPFKPDGKTYRFFDQLEALEHNPNIPNPLILHCPPPPPTTTNDSNPPRYAAATAPSLPTSPTPLSVLPPSANCNPQQPLPISQAQPTNSHFKFSTNLVMETSSSSSSSSDEEDRRRGRKRKWKDYLQRLIRDVVEKQEEMHKRFLEALEKVERDRISREQVWRVEEIERKNKEHDLLVQERSMAAAKDAALITFLQKITTDPQLNNFKLPLSLPALQVPPTPQPQRAMQQPEIRAPEVLSIMDKHNVSSGTVSHGSSSRWPKAEVLALINLRTSLDKYQDSGPKGPLWEDISAEMAKLGYNRSSKRCKEKWENINKYYKKVKESNKKQRPEDSKTCPYFHYLEAVYTERSRNQIPPSSLNPNASTFNSSSELPNLMPRPEPIHDLGLNNNETDEEEEEEEDDDEMGDGGFQMIPPPPSTATTTTTVE